MRRKLWLVVKKVVDVASKRDIKDIAYLRKLMGQTKSQDKERIVK